jgi:cytochrome c5
MKIARINVLLVCVLAAFLYCVAQVHGQSAQSASPAQPTASDQTAQRGKSSASASASKQASASEGEKRFEAQCGRCHVPPEDLSPREARAVVRQMRVRAMISAEDERLILKYIAP